MKSHQGNFDFSDFQEVINYYIGISGTQGINYTVPEDFIKKFRDERRISQGYPFMIVDHSTMDYVYITPNIKSLLGYDAGYILEGGFELTMKMMHPEDRERIFVMSDDMFRFLFSLPKEERKDYKFCYATRIRRSDGKYIWMYQEVWFFIYDRAGNPLLAYVNLIDASHLKKDDLITLNCFRQSESEGLCLACSKNYPLSDDMPGLTIREMEIIKMIGEGLLTKQIADRLDISVKTVNTHRQNMLRKNNTATIAGLLNKAIRYGLIAKE